MADLVVIPRPRRTVVTTITGIVFGADYQFVVSNARSTTTLIAFQNKVTLATGAITGTYRLVWSCEVDNADKFGEVRLFNNTDAVVLDGPRIFRVKNSAERVTESGQAEIVLAGVTKDVIIQFRAQVAGQTHGIGNARIAFWRVA